MNLKAPNLVVHILHLRRLILLVFKKCSFPTDYILGQRNAL